MRKPGAKGAPTAANFKRAATKQKTMKRKQPKINLTSCITLVTKEFLLV